MSQLVLPGGIPGSFWVVVYGHGVIPDGQRYLVVEDRGDGYWLAWRDGHAPRAKGTLLGEKYFRRESK